MDILVVLFCTVLSTYMVMLDRLFLQDRVKWYSERHWMCPRKKVRPFANEIATTMQREKIPATGAYLIVKSTHSRMDDPYEHVLEYKSY